jgi:nucleotide-binding universal stress UspA family protein
MVGIDFSSADAALLKYTKMLAEMAKPSIVYFVHAERDLDIPEEVMEELGIDMRKPADEALLRALEERVAPYFKTGQGCEIVCQVVEGEPFKEMLHWSHIKNVDLLMVGKKAKENGKGVLPQKLARKVDCSLVFVPEDLEKFDPINTILLPMDFSKKSKLAVDTAVQLFGENTIELVAANSYSLPLGWEKTGRTREEFDTVMRKHAIGKFEHFLEGYTGHKLNMRSIFEIDDNNEPSEEIMHMAQVTGADLVMVGARGKSDLATVVLGSTTEKILGHDKQIPIFVIKQKGEVMGFLEALFQMK